MTDKADYRLPVDRGETADVSEAAWRRDDSPDRCFERLGEDGAVRAHFDAVLAEIHDQARLAPVALVVETGLAGVREWEAEFGELTPEELARADHILGTSTTRRVAG